MRPRSTGSACGPSITFGPVRWLQIPCMNADDCVDALGDRVACEQTLEVVGENGDAFAVVGVQHLGEPPETRAELLLRGCAVQRTLETRGEVGRQPCFDTRNGAPDAAGRSRARRATPVRREVLGHLTAFVLPAARSGFLMSSSLAAQVKEVIVRELNLQDMRPEDIHDDVQLFGGGLGLDSLDALQLAMALEDHFDIKLPEGDAVRPVFRSVATIVEFIEKSRAHGVE